MLIVQLTGLSGAGKTTIAENVAQRLSAQNIPVEVIDGDVFRNSPINSDLGFSVEDRKKNLERLFFIGTLLARHNIVVLIAAINPFEELRNKFSTYSKIVKTIWIKCDFDTLVKRDTKGLYKKAMLPVQNKDKVNNFTGISSPYEEPVHPDLTIDTAMLNIEESVDSLYSFILAEINNLGCILKKDR